MGTQWESLLADRVKSMRASDIREAFKLAERADIISFAGGFPGSESFPGEELAEVARDVISRRGAIALQYGPTDGLLELRAYIAAGMRRHGAEVGPDNILITSGSQQALDLVCKIFLNPGDSVIVERPSYMGGLGAIYNYEGSLMGIPLDQDGLQVDLLEERLQKLSMSGALMPKFAYVIPDFQNPTGICLSAERRRRLLELAHRFHFLILEDSPYVDLRFEGEQIPSVLSFDSSGRVIHLGSFSKTFVPGIRLGWVAGDAQIIRQLAIAKQATDLCSACLGQEMVLECARRGLLEPHVAELNRFYQARRDAVLSSLDAEFQGVDQVRWTRPQGGFFSWLTLPEEVDAKELLPTAIERGVGYVAGSGFHPDGEGRNTIRLAYSQPRLATIPEGVNRLAQVLRPAIERAGAGRKVAIG